MPDPNAYSREAQDARRLALMAAVREANAACFDADGAWACQWPEPSARERFWHALAFLAGGPDGVELANRIIERSEITECDFAAFFSTLLSRLHEPRLSDASRSVLEHALHMHIEHVHEHIHRYTENCGLLNVFALLEAGRRLGEPRFVERAMERLEVYVHDAATSGASKEFFSVAYWGVTLTGCAAISELAHTAQARRAGRKLQAGLWLEMGAAWHPRLKYSAAPSARSYTAQSMASLAHVRTAAWLALGADASASPFDAGLFDEPARCPLHRQDAPWVRAGCAWIAALPYRVEPATAALFLHKSYPYHMRTAVHVSGRRDHEKVDDPSVDVNPLGGWRCGPDRHVPSKGFQPGGTALISTFMQPGYGVGTASRGWLGQCDFCFGIWQRHREVRTLADVRTMYTRYVINDALERELGPERFSTLLREEGRGGALQSGPLAVAWYHCADAVTCGIERLRTCVVLPAFYHDVDEVWIGDRRLEGLDGTSDREEWVFIRDGQTYLAWRPLRLTNHGRREAIEVKRLARFRALTFANYEGEPRDFHVAQLRQTVGGFVFCIGSSEEWSASFRDFRQSCQGAEIDDSTYQSHRRIECRWRDRQIQVLHDVQTEESIFAKVDGQFVEPSLLEWSDPTTHGRYVRRAARPGRRRPH